MISETVLRILKMISCGQLGQASAYRRFVFTRTHSRDRERRFKRLGTGARLSLKSGE